MIVGCKGWNDKTGYYRQDNNAQEEFLRSYGVKQYFATCFPTSVCRGIAAVRGEKNLWCKTSGGWWMQPEDALTMCMNDPTNRHFFEAIRSTEETNDMPENQIPQYFPKAVEIAFKEKVTFEWGGAKRVKELLLTKKHAVVAIKLPGHAVCLVSYDVFTGEFIYDDPLHGFNLRTAYGTFNGSFMNALVVV